MEGWEVGRTSVGFLHTDVGYGAEVDGQTSEHGHKLHV